MQHTSEYTTVTPAYLAKLPCAKHAWPDVCNIIDSARKSIRTMNSQNTFVELEMRFGRRLHGFQPGVSEQSMRDLEARFDSGREWKRVDPCHNIHVFFHASAVPGDRRKLRTEVTFRPGCEESKRVECTQKELVCNHDYRTVALALPETTSQNAPADIRIALNVEHAVPKADVPEITVPSAVHLKTRKCYYYAPTGTEEPVWCYVLTKRWMGTTLQDAKIAQATKEPTYEMEIECLSPDYLVSVDGGKVAAKMLYKACDVLDILVPELRDKSAYMIEPTQNAMLWTRHK